MSRPNTLMTFKVNCQIQTKITGHGVGFATQTVKAKSADAAVELVNGATHGKKPAVGSGFKLYAYGATRVV